MLGDAGKLADASRCGIAIHYEQLPISPQLASSTGDMRARELALTGGDDYELCFAVPPENVERLTHDLPPSRWDYRPIGLLREAAGAVVTRDGTVMDFSHSGFDHFGS